MVFNVTFINIAGISWWAVLLMEETGVHGENHRPVVSHWQTSSHNVQCIEDTSPWTELQLTNLMVIYTDCIASCKSKLTKNSRLPRPLEYMYYLLSSYMYYRGRSEIWLKLFFFTQLIPFQLEKPLKRIEIHVDGGMVMVLNCAELFVCWRISSRLSSNISLSNWESSSWNVLLFIVRQGRNKV